MALALNTMDTNEHTPVQTIADDMPYPSAPELQLQLATILQTTLDLETLMQLFYEEIADNLKISGLAYRSEEGEIQLELGVRGAVNCSYQLSTPESGVGELKFFLDHTPRESLLKLLEISIGSLLYPLRNALTYRDVLKAALTDQLTGAGNRAALDSTLNREINLSKRHNQPLSMLAIDIDWFKKINDTYGHHAGDEILRGLVDTIAKPSRSTDDTFRYGGEEFVVLLHNTTPLGASIIAERVREAIEKQTIVVDGNSIKITASIGVATLNVQDTPTTFFQRADQALYEAKRNGRNRVETFVQTQAEAEPA